MCEGELEWTMFLPSSPPIAYLILTKWLWDPRVEKLEKNIMGVGMHRIVKQMGKVDSNNWVKTITLENYTS